MSPHLVVRPALESEAAVVASLIRESFAGQAEALRLSPADCPDYVAFETNSGVQRRMAAGCEVVLAYSGRMTVGTISYDHSGGAGLGEIMRLAVLPSHRRNGYGRRLMRYAERRLVNAGATAARLSIVAQFTKLQAYYETLGYVGTVRTKVSGLPFELLFMEKQLAPPAKG